VAPLPKRRILLHSNRTIERANDLSIIFVHEHEPPAEVYLLFITRFRSCRCCHLCASVYVCGISDEYAVEELDVVHGFGRRGELEAKLRVVPRSMEDVTVAPCCCCCCTGGGQSGHGEGARGIEWRFEGAVASSDS